MRWLTWELVFFSSDVRGFPYLVPKFMTLIFLDITIHTMDKRLFAEKYIHGKRKNYILTMFSI